jgi:FtsP/CotA-like multicopper oxidase with cupredoxin domain
MRKLLFIFSFFGMAISSFAQQITTTNIFSKMDMGPQHILWDGTNTMLMGFTSLMMTPIDIPGPTLVYTEGDSVELKLRNMSQSASHSIHLHGLDVDQWNDGVPHLSWEVGHNATESYYFKAPHPGTYLYHCHVTSSLHVQAGMYGLLIVKPQNANETWDGGFTFDKEYAWMTSEIDTIWHTDSIINYPHDTTTTLRELPDYNPQYFFVNGRSEHQLLDTNVAAITAKANETVLLRLANIGYFGNRIIFPNQLNAKIISSDGRPLPNIEVSDTLEILPGERYQVLLQSSIEFSDSISVDYFNLNTQNIANTQKVPVSVSGFVSSVNDIKKEVLFYPNPVSNALYFTKNTTFASVFDVNGKIILSANNNINAIDVSMLSNGIYFIDIDGVKTKFVKQ